MGVLHKMLSPQDKNPCHFSCCIVLLFCHKSKFKAFLKFLAFVSFILKNGWLKSSIPEPIFLWQKLRCIGITKCWFVHKQKASNKSNEMHVSKSPENKKLHSLLHFLKRVSMIQEASIFVLLYARCEHFP